jgi:hypothetical protein
LNTLDDWSRARVNELIEEDLLDHTPAAVVRYRVSKDLDSSEMESSR